MHLHFNKLNGIFSVRRIDRSTVTATRKGFKIPRVGTTHQLAPNVHILITKGVYEKATTKSRPEVIVKVTNWPRVQLFIARLKEAFDE